MDNPLIQVQHLFRSLAEQVVSATTAEPAAVGWSEVALDARFSPESSLQIGKIRAKVGGELVSISALYGDIIDLISAIRKNRIGDPFYGFVLTVTGKGEVQIRLNYDPNCYNDPEFAAT
jgi:hypothetical protein